MAAKNTCILYGDIIEYVEGDDALSDAQVAELYRAQLAYINGRDVVIKDPEVKGIWRFVKSRIDKDNKLYENKCERNKANATQSKRTQANATERSQSLPNATERKRIGSDNDNDNDNDLKEKGNTCVLPEKKTAHPTVEDVRAYCAERHNNVDAERFVDYYTANGWKVGKNPMKDWKAAVRNWERDSRAAPKKDDPIASWLARTEAEDEQKRLYQDSRHAEDIPEMLCG